MSRWEYLHLAATLKDLLDLMSIHIFIEEQPISSIRLLVVLFCKASFNPAAMLDNDHVSGSRVQGLGFRLA